MDNDPCVYFMRRLVDNLKAFVKVALPLIIINLAVIVGTILEHVHLSAILACTLVALVHSVIVHRLVILRDPLVEERR